MLRWNFILSILLLSLSFLQTKHAIAFEVCTPENFKAAKWELQIQDKLKRIFKSASSTNKIGNTMVSFAVRLPASSNNEQLYLAKILQLSNDTKKRTPPKNIRLFRTKTKKYQFFKKFFEYELTPLFGEKVDSLSYELFHALPNQFTKSGAIERFHSDYISGNVSLKTFNQELATFTRYNFEELGLSLPQKDYNAVALALNKSISDLAFLRQTLAGIGITTDDHANLNPKENVISAVAKLADSPKGEAGKGHILCFTVIKKIGADRIKIYIDHANDVNAGNLVNMKRWSLDW